MWTNSYLINVSTPEKLRRHGDQNTWKLPWIQYTLTINAPTMSDDVPTEKKRSNQTKHREINTHVIEIIVVWNFCDDYVNKKRVRHIHWWLPTISFCVVSILKNARASGTHDRFVGPKQSFTSHMAHAFCLRWRALKVLICTSVTYLSMEKNRVLLLIASARERSSARVRFAIGSA
jgi:hypothetical protein